MPSDPAQMLRKPDTFAPPSNHVAPRPCENWQFSETSGATCQIMVYASINSDVGKQARHTGVNHPDYPSSRIFSSYAAVLPAHASCSAVAPQHLGSHMPPQCWTSPCTHPTSIEALSIVLCLIHALSMLFQQPLLTQAPLNQTLEPHHPDCLLRPPSLQTGFTLTR